MARVLLLGSERQRAAGLRGLLAQDDYDVTWLRSLAGWPARERETRPDLIVATVEQAEGVLQAAARTRTRFPAPLLFVQREGDFLREPHLAERLVDRLRSPFMSDEFLARVDALIRVRRVVCREETAGRGGVGGSWRKLRLSVSGWLRASLPEKERPHEPYLEVAARVAEWADRRDAFEPGHAERVASFCGMIAEGLGMEEPETQQLLRAAMLHDIGKVALPVEVLHQQQPLEENQRRLIRTHPARGATLLRMLDPDEGVARVVLYHHERPDGCGYYGKERGGIPRGAYALAVAEAYDAMTSSLLGQTYDSRRALDILMKQRGDAFDGPCVDALADALSPRLTAIPLSSV